MKKSTSINLVWKRANVEGRQPEFVTRKNKTVGSGKENFDFRGLRTAGCVKLRVENIYKLFYLPSIVWVMESRRMGDVRQGEGVGWHPRSGCRWQVHLWRPFCDVTVNSRGRSRGWGRNWFDRNGQGSWRGREIEYFNKKVCILRSTNFQLLRQTNGYSINNGDFFLISRFLSGVAIAIAGIGRHKI